MNKPAYYSQNDSRWKKIMYSSKGDSSQTIGNSGCGPTCAAMVIQTLRGNGITPVQTCEWSVKHGYRTASQGTDWAYFVPQLAAYGIPARSCWNMNEAIQALKDGYMVIGRAKAGLWTSGGHYILAWKIDGETIFVNDPNSTAKKKSQAPLQNWRAEVMPMWIVEEKEMTQEQFNEMFKEAMKEYEAEKAAAAGSYWSEASRQWANETGLIVGDSDGRMRWKSYITREEIAALFHRFYKKFIR